MEVRTAASPKDVKHYTTDRLREEFLIQDYSRQTRSIWYTATLTVSLQEQQFRSMRNWFSQQEMNFVQNISFREESLESSISVEMESSQSMDVFMK